MRPDFLKNRGLDAGLERPAPVIGGDIAGAVASMTEGEPGVVSEGIPRSPCFSVSVFAISAFKEWRARCLDVQSDVGELSLGS